ncbi:MAG: phosphatase PAP2 family protein [Clostridia bacterium]|nr:MAG: phosphatase PAP2 family protein [Clostridia bacterium]
MELILWLQQFASPPLDYFFVALSWLGTEEFYLLVIPAIYWFVDARLGYSLGVLFCSTMYLNGFLKDTLAMPRPDPALVRVVYAESGTGYGFPSGHAQSSASFWGYVATRHFRWPLALALAGLVFLVSLSRLYLGLHFPADVAGGAAIGLAVLAVFKWAEGWLARWRWPWGEFWRVILLVGSALWPLLFYRSHLAWQLSGALAGMNLGYELAGRLPGQHSRSRWWQQVLKGGLGFLVLAVWYLVSKSLALAWEWFTLVRYFSVAFIGFFVLPWAFVRLGMGDVEGGKGADALRGNSLDVEVRRNCR